MVTQTSLFSSHSEVYALPDGRCTLVPGFLDNEDDHAIYEHLLAHTPWSQDRVRVYGKQHLAPRMSCWMADAGLSYHYSNMTLQPTPWLPRVLELAKTIGRIAEVDFNSALLNHYRSGQDSNGWHADNEPELGPDPIVASLSLGAARDFRLRHNVSRQTHSIRLEHGSLLIMHEGMQTHWQHCVPKRAQADSRINLTFRRIVR